MPLAEPTSKKLALIAKNANVGAAGSEALEENFQWWFLYGNESGFYRDKADNKAEWKKVGDAWERIRYRMRRREWIELHVKIKNKGGDMVPMVLNQAQRDLLAKVYRLHRAGRPVRIAILKARQLGFCGAPWTRVLTADLRWKTLDEIKVGDEVVAVDEHKPGGRGAGRKMRTGVVEAKGEVFETAYRLTMSNGRTLTLTSGHRMLCRKRGGSEQIWKPVSEMSIGDELRLIADPWGDTTPEDGWFGGILDGEGSFNRHGSPSLCASQIRGPVWDRMIRYCQDRGFSFTIESDNKPERPSKFGKKPVPKVVIGRMNEMFRLVGLTRPIRFLPLRWWEGRDLPGKRVGCTEATILSIEECEAQRMIDLQTSTKTFIAEGFVSHNSTFIQALGAERSMRRLLSRVLLIGHRKETASLILDKVHKLVTRLPKRGEDAKRWSIVLRRSSRKEIAFEVPMESVIEIDSAEVPEPGHGDTVDMLHMTETSRWPDASLKAKGLEQVVPERPGTEIYDETTANGDTGYFRNKFVRAYYGDAGSQDADDDDFRGWVAHFTPWFADQEYRWTFMRGVTELPDRVKHSIEASLDDVEKRLLATKYLLRGKGWVYVDYDQLAWRRFWKQTKCDDNWSTFNEQYPGFPEDAFLASGRTVFDNRQLADAMKLTTDPIWVGDIPEAAAPTKQAMEALLAQL